MQKQERGGVSSLLGYMGSVTQIKPGAIEVHPEELAIVVQYEVILQHILLYAVG